MIATYPKDSHLPERLPYPMQKDNQTSLEPDIHTYDKH